MTYNRDIIKRIKRLASVCLCLLASLCVYLLASSTLYAAHQVKDGILSHITDTVACRQWVDSQLKQMTLKQRIGQLFIHTVEPSVLQRNKDQILWHRRTTVLIGSSGETGTDNQPCAEMEPHTVDDYFRRRMGTVYAPKRYACVPEEQGIGMHKQ